MTDTISDVCSELEVPSADKSDSNDATESKSNGRRWPEPIGSIRAAFKQDRRSEEFRKLVVDQFTNATNPYEAAATLTESSPDFLQPRLNTMSLAVLKEFQIWIRAEERQKKYESLLTLDIQKRAFHIATKRHTILLKTAVDVFHLVDAAETFVDDIRAMAGNGLFREAAECATALNVQRYFGLNEIIIPCILQDKINFVEPYLAGIKELQQELVEVLDELCAPEANICQFLSHYRVPGIRKDKLWLKPLQKLIARLSKLYDIPTERTPNLTLTRSQGTLRYLLHKRYDEKSIKDDNWHDMVKQGIESCPLLLSDLFKLLCFTYNDYDEAAKWAGFYQVAMTELPHKLQCFINRKPEALFPENGVDMCDDANRSVNNGSFLCLPIPPDAVVIVENEDALLQAMSQIEDADIVGLDTEWRPGFGQAIEHVALLQIATPQRVFLIDIQTLKEAVISDVLKDAMRRLFCYERPRKLGFGFSGDVKTMAVTLPFCQSEFSDMTNTVCISELIKHLIQENVDFVAGFSAIAATQQNSGNEASSLAITTKASFGLAELCHQLLGEPLDKSEQYSNWSRRPLRWDQIRYAALDAYCLLSIYEKLRHRAVELKVDFERAVLRSLVNGHKAVGPGREKKQTQSMKKIQRAELCQLVQELNAHIDAAECGSIRRPADVRVVADTMLQGLGRHLRRCGVDCKIAENHESREAIIGVAKKDRRILLTSGAVVSMAASRLPSELICAVPPSFNAKEKLSWLLKKLRIRVTEADIFSRCMICNCPQFLFVASFLLRIIYDSVVAPNDVLSMEPFNRQAAFEKLRAYLQRDSGANSGQANGTPASQVIPFAVNDDHWPFEFNGTKVDLLTGTIQSENQGQIVHIQIESIPAESAFDKINLFYVCSECGKIYWDGSHTGRYVSGIKDIVELDQSDCSEKETESAAIAWNID